jgi:hypothetical protein
VNEYAEEVVAFRETLCQMDEQQTHNIASREPRARRWYVLDIVLIGGFLLAYAGFFGVSSLTRYWDGLSNGGRPMLDLLVVLGLGAVSLGLFVVLAVQVLIVWRKRIESRRRFIAAALSLSIVLVVWIALPFMGLWPPGYEPFTSGFREYVRANVNLAVVREWLNAQDPNLFTGRMIEVADPIRFTSCWPDTVVWASAITQLNPHYVQLDKTETGRPKIRLTWGGALGHWGVEIGPEDMPIPETLPRRRNVIYGQVFWDEGEYRLPLAPGAYVWYEIQ